MGRAGSLAWTSGEQWWTVTGAAADTSASGSVHGRAPEGPGHDPTTLPNAGAPAGPRLWDRGCVATLATPRLLLLPLSRSMIATRLVCDDFTLGCETPEGVASVHFGPEWPGDASGHFPDLLRYLGDEVIVEGTFAIVERATLEAIGQIGTVGVPDEHGVVEIGYWVSRSRSGNGFATEAVGAITAHLLEATGVTRVTASTTVGNIASQRVLEANGYRRTLGARTGGPLQWAREQARGPASGLARRARG